MSNAFEKKILFYIDREQKRYDEYIFTIPNIDNMNEININYIKNKFNVTIDQYIYLKHFIEHVKDYNIIKKLFATCALTKSIYKKSISYINNGPMKVQIESYLYYQSDCFQKEILMLYYKHHPYKYLEWHYKDIKYWTHKFICKNYLISYKKFYKFMISSVKLKTLKEKQNVIQHYSNILFELDIVDEELLNLTNKFEVKNNEDFNKHIAIFLELCIYKKNIEKIRSFLKNTYKSVLNSENIVLKIGTILDE